MVSVREIEASYIHSCVQHPHEHLSLPTGGSKRADDLSLALRELDLLEDILETNATGVSRSGVCFNHSIFTISSKVWSQVGLCTWNCSFLKSLN